MRFISFTTVLSVLFLTSCKVSPEPIHYGFDGCHFCSMTIVDKQHASEFVTQKGKVYKFDASECMINYLKDIDNSTVALFLVNDYNSPGDLIDATTATYLISENIPSPMGAYLTAFENRVEAELVQAANKGELFTWKELQLRFE